jgi:molecular chaperone DnaJ
VVVEVAPHRLFGRKGKNLTITVPISFAEAALGSKVSVPTVDGGAVTLRIPPGTPNGKKFRVKGKGVGEGSAGGDLLVAIEIAVPAKVSAEQRQALERLAEVFPDSPRSHLQSEADS